MTYSERARAFAALHNPGTPLVLYNIWDAGSAAALARTDGGGTTARVTARFAASLSPARSHAASHARPHASPVRTS